MKYLLKILLLLAVVGKSCNTKESPPPNEFHSDKVLIDKFKNLSDTLGENGLYTVSKLLGLNDIKESGQDEEIRIWFGYALSDSGKLVILKNADGSWMSQAYFFKYTIDNKLDIASIEKRVEQEHPSSGWSEFLDKIKGLGIYKLKSIEEIPRYSMCSGGDVLTFEISKDNHYSIFDYPCYDHYVDEIEIEDIKKLKEICLLIQKEFGYRLYPRPK